jgi:predicted ATP-grasp superfamily ATP-dependent carboligase
MRRQLGDEERVPAVVLGLGQNGLASVRALGRQGVTVYGIDTDLSQPGAGSRYCRPIACPDAKQGGPGLLDKLLELGPTFAERPVLFPSGDLNLGVISKAREALSPFYRVSLPDADVIDLALNKRAFYQFASQNGLPIPRTYFLESEPNIEAISREVEYPCIIKPFQPTAAWRQTFDTRLFIVRSREVLLPLYEKLYAVHQDLVLQEYMSGPDSELHFGMTYLDRAQEPLAVWSGHKLRMYPTRFGTATFAISKYDPWIAENTVSILRQMGVRGYGTIEFKRDQRDGKFKMTEATVGRTWFPHGLVTASGVNLPYIWYRDALGLPVTPVRSFVEGLKWIHEERDLKTVWLYFIPNGELTVRSWLASYRGQRTYAYSAWDDPRPILRSIGRVAGVALRRVRRKLFSPAARPAERVQATRPTSEAAMDIRKLRAESRGAYLH